MKKKQAIAIIAAVTMAASMFAACGSSSDTGSQDAATTEEAATEEASSQEASETTEAAEETEAASGSQASGDVSGTVATNGSTSMEEVIGALSEQFMTDNPDVTVTYDATGSGTGIESVSNGSCDIGLASRALKDEETSNGLVATTIALDGIAIIVNENNPISDLSVEQIASIFKGETTDWSSIDGGNAGEISCIGREAGSGTRDGFETITETTDQCKLAQELTSTGAVIEAVKNNENAIGYASYSSVAGQSGIKAITVGGVECTEENISDGSYVIQRPFNLVTKDGQALSDAAQAFFDYATSKDAAELISGAGAVPTAK
ncbi:MAG: phosphate ABC transporter substrate-binding protein [Bilifractor sp.]|jgi:phosphate transport system substrate-binding protein